MNNTLNIYKVRPTAKLPVRAHPTDAGMDIFYCPEEHSGWLSIKPGGTTLLETGLKISVPEGHMLQIMNKSGIATKKQLVTGACVVDSGYDGELFVNLHNIGTTAQVIEPGQKIAQAVLIPLCIPQIKEIPTDSIYDKETSRGTGGFGSTGDY
tara:strand:- start:19 stop:477 length:459 start_codon:yes stop_codon:yes gene_type:complete